MADDAVTAVRASLPELRPFLPWATDGYDVEASRQYIARSANNWANRAEFNYAILTTAGVLIGSIGLMTRMGPSRSR